MYLLSRRDPQRDRQSRQLAPWPSDLRYEDEPRVEPYLITRLSPPDTTSRSLTGNAARRCAETRASGPV